VRKKLTITVVVYDCDGHHREIGKRKISRFIEGLVRPHVVRKDLDAAYEAMARDYTRESSALEWAEETLGDIPDEQG